ncbi:ABC transporter ATP-binding/permease protein YojI [Campylobacter majalis]|uniref:ABC transporter ATP-binding/permease protein YojI n=1 Tax=Campylobacter majalis TaxID=2790656 RepID=A0ABM8Q5L3_9BACT|nr:multidrug ABC transporter permease/ATP-binding protein [Campylobacter majalis]CAD7288135.1 ABC transporter ATP-binding/permease protein YojI [Campylobacter majalis]
MIKNLLKKSIPHLIKIVILTLIYSGLGIATLSFINSKILTITKFDLSVILQFITLLLVFLSASIYANITLAKFGHNLVYNMRKELVKRLLDTPSYQIELIGKAKIIASLNNDIRSISFAFMSAPGLIQGLVFIIAVSIYLLVISPKLFVFIFIWIGVTLSVGTYFMSKIHHYFKLARASDDALQASFEDSVEGHKELMLNRARAELSFAEFDVVAQQKKYNLIRADIYHSISDNWSNIMLLGLVGMCIFLSISLEWASMQTAVTVGLTILFLRGSLNALVSSIPTMLAAKISFEKIMALNFVDFSDGFDVQNSLNNDWKSIKFQDINFKYNDKFGLKNLNLELKRGEIVFLIGKNGSGKSTFCNLLCGLLQPSSGKIMLDDTEISHKNLRDYQSKISAIFSEFYLFSQVIDNQGKSLSEDEVKDLLVLLDIDEKVSVIDGKLSTTSLSQGQRKRLSLFLALCERRSLLVLDEWAADQDPVFKRVFYREILPLLKSRGITILAISHDDNYFDVAERIILAKDGYIRELKGDEREIASRDAVEKIS